MQTLHRLIPDQLPKSIDIEPTTRCNFACIICKRTYWNRKAHDMTLAQFEHIYNSFPKLEFLKLQGVGEPLLNKDIFKMIELAKKHGTHVTTYTNGSLLHKNNNSARLLGSGIDLIRISIDGGTKKTFEAVRKYSDFEQILHNLKLLVNARKGPNQQQIELWVVALPENLRELPQIVDIACDAGIETFYVQLLLNTIEYSEDVGTQLLKLRLHGVKDARFHLYNGKEYARRKGINLYFFASRVYSDMQKCHWPFDSLFINVGGDIIPCGVIADPQVISLGNIFDQDIGEIWESEKYQDFRRTIIDNELSAPCRGCYSELNKISLLELDVPSQSTCYPFSGP